MIKKSLFSLVAALLLQPVAALAVPIVYTYTGVGTGSLGASGFSNHAFTITATADTDNVQPWVNAGGGPQNTHLGTTVDLGALSTHTFTVTAHTWLANGCCGGLGANLANNWITIDAPGFASVGYDLASNLGPVLDTTPDTHGQFVNIGTTGGALTFNSMANVTFQATVVPEPASALLLALGLAGVAVAGRRRIAA